MSSSEPVRKPVAVAVIAGFALLIAGGLIVLRKDDPEQDETKNPQTAVGQEQQGRNNENKSSREDSEDKFNKAWLGLVDDSLSRRVRLQLAQRIDKNLSKQDIDFLFKAMRHSPPQHRQSDWWLVMNEIMEQMRKKGVAKDRLSNELISLAEDKAQPVVVRDYAIQHLALWVSPPRSSTIPREENSENVARALASMAGVITDPAIAHSSIPGTSLMSLLAASKVLPEKATSPVWKQLDPALASMLRGETAVPLSMQTTVVQVFALRKSPDQLPLVQGMARDEKIAPSLRLSAIAALGVYQSVEDRDYLTSLLDGDSRYRHAAQSALKRINQQ